MKELQIFDTFDAYGDLQAVKAALMQNQSLVRLGIICDRMYAPQDTTMLLFQGLAAVPNLRILDLEVNGLYDDLPQEQQGESMQRQSDMFAIGFAKAMVDCCNSSLETISPPTGISTRILKIFNHKSVSSILQFNRKRHAFQERAIDSSSSSFQQRNAQLVQALAAANAMDNHHLLYWLVRNYAGDLCCGIGGHKQAESNQQSANSMDSDNMIKSRIHT
jgi:hypothetical protein